MYLLKPKVLPILLNNRKIPRKKKKTKKLPWGFPGSSTGKESSCNAGDPGSISGSVRSPGEGNGNPLQYSRLENPV